MFHGRGPLVMAWAPGLTGVGVDTSVALLGLLCIVGNAFNRSLSGVGEG